MNYKKTLAQISELEQGIQELKSSGDFVFGSIDSARSGGNATGNISTQYRLRISGEKAQYIKKDDLSTVQDAVARGRQIRSLERELLKAMRHKDKIESFAADNGIKLITSNLLGDREATCEWYTPPSFVEMARQVLGSIELDPASNTLAQTWIKAGRYYTKNDDGLSQPWMGRIWCNPPYGTPEVRLMTQKFLERGLEAYQRGEIESAVFLVNRTGAAWYKKLLPQFTARCEVCKRISFLDSEGKKQGRPRYYNDFLYLGLDSYKFKEIFREIGEIR